ncbi:UNVERIFIED_CONTAM: hypothetical protein Cloal_1324 [Acetivibrio alkalicellulosi]
MNFQQIDNKIIQPKKVLNSYPNYDFSTFYNTLILHKRNARIDKAILNIKSDNKDKNN